MTVSGYTETVTDRKNSYLDVPKRNYDRNCHCKRNYLHGYAGKKSRISMMFYLDEPTQCNTATLN